MSCIAKLNVTNYFNRMQLDDLSQTSSDVSFFMVIYLFLVCHSFNGIIYYKIYFPSFKIFMKMSALYIYISCLVYMCNHKASSSLCFAHSYYTLTFVYEPNLLFFFYITLFCMLYVYIYILYFVYSFCCCCCLVCTVRFIGLYIPGHLVYDSHKSLTLIYIDRMTIFNCKFHQ